MTGRTDSAVLARGRLLLVNNQIDPTSGTVQLKATFANKDHALWPGQFVAVQLLVQTRHAAVTVPAAAVQRGPQGLYAYVLDAGQLARIVPIKVSTANAGGPVALIDEGLVAGQTVIVDGQLRLRPGARVSLPAAASAASATAATSATAAAPISAAASGASPPSGTSATSTRSAASATAASATSR